MDEKANVCLMANENTQESRVSIEVMVKKKKNLVSGPSDALTKLWCNIYLNEQINLRLIKQQKISKDLSQ